MVQSAELSLQQIRDLLRLPTTTELLAELLAGPASPPELTIVRSGLYLGAHARVEYIVGRRDQGWDNATDLGDCAAYLDTTQSWINDVSPATTYYLRSSSAVDTFTGPGTGAQRMRIVSLTAAGVQQVTDVALNGLTPVSLGNGYSYSQWMEVSAVGSGTVAAGNITISTDAAGAPTVSEIVEYIGAGGNRSLSARYKVPVGHRAYLCCWDGSSIGAANIDARLRATVFADDRTLAPAHHFQDLFYLVAGQHHDQELGYVPCPEGAEIKVSGIPSAAAAGNRLDASFRMLVIAD